ncbi:MAG TPA: S-methyl-5'-thioadenosine phosphorylase [Elusimicrobia bacterium]|jgi:5'-methylthioadenosine phosphorylase|nr:S-methyl-5'-thioadenosine phosphorylase [Elusimicrobiota bacterium]
MQGEAKIGIIGGSGLYEIEGLKNVKEVKIDTPFGQPSDKIILGNLEGINCAFLPRHGRGHWVIPAEINSRANIYALKKLGVEQIIAISACGSLREEIRPRDFVLPDQLFDRTKMRVSSFFQSGLVGHVGFAHPFCSELTMSLYHSAKSLNLPVHLGGTYVCIEGPQFSTKAESAVNRLLGFSIIGMTALPEAKLAREAEICYATIGLVTDYDVWKEEEHVTIKTVLNNMKANVENVKKLIKTVLPNLDRKRNCECATAMKYAVITAKNKMDKKVYNKLKLLIGKYV